MVVCGTGSGPTARIVQPANLLCRVGALTQGNDRARVPMPHDRQASPATTTT